MKILYKIIILAWFMIAVNPVYAQSDYIFDNESQQIAFQKLIKECRCMTCPNQNIADSNAPIARAMVEEIYQRVKKNESSADISAFLQSHYGDYVLYNPQLKKSTWILWLGPFLMLLLGCWIWLKLFTHKTANRC